MALILLHILGSKIKNDHKNYPKDWAQLLQGKGLPHTAIRIMRLLDYGEALGMLKALPGAFKEDKEEFKRAFQQLKVYHSQTSERVADFIATTAPIQTLTLNLTQFALW